MTVIFVGVHGKAISARSTRVSVDAHTIDETEEFDLIERDAGRFALRTATGRFVRAWPEGKVDADVEWIRDWEHFRLVQAGIGRFGILTHHGHFLSAQPNGELLAASPHLRSWEEFYLHVLSNADALAQLSTTPAPWNPTPISSDTIYDYCRAHPAECQHTAHSLVKTILPTPSLLIE